MKMIVTFIDSIIFINECNDRLMYISNFCPIMPTVVNHCPSGVECTMTDVCQISQPVINCSALSVSLIYHLHPLCLPSHMWELATEPEGKARFSVLLEDRALIAQTHYIPAAAHS